LFVDVHLLLSRKKTIELPNNQLEKADDRRGQNIQTELFTRDSQIIPLTHLQPPTLRPHYP